VKIALLKDGAANSCLHRMEMARQERRFCQRGISTLTLFGWKSGLRSRTGDLAEPGLDERSQRMTLDHSRHGIIALVFTMSAFSPVSQTLGQ
jgi:hypothetical protein